MSLHVLRSWNRLSTVALPLAAACVFVVVGAREMWASCQAKRLHRATEKQSIRHIEVLYSLLHFSVSSIHRAQYNDNSPKIDFTSASQDIYISAHA